MMEKSQIYTYKALEKIGVKVMLGKMLQDYKDEVVYFKDGDTIETKTLIWTAGVVAQRFKGIPEQSYSRGNRLLVNDFNQVEGTDNIYAVGDVCLQKTDSEFPEGHPQLANVAMEQGIQLGKNFIAMTKGEPLKPFRYNDKGSMAIIGRNMAVADLTTPNRSFTGWFAWMLWLFIHLFQLINYRNRIKTMWNWTIAYFTQDQSLGMIVRPSHRVEEAAAELSQPARPEKVESTAASQPAAEQVRRPLVLRLSYTGAHFSQKKGCTSRPDGTLLISNRRLRLIAPTRRGDAPAGDSRSHSWSKRQKDGRSPWYESHFLYRIYRQAGSRQSQSGQPVCPLPAIRYGRPCRYTGRR